MASPSRRAVITGLGLVTPIGLGVAPFWEALVQGRSGIRRIASFDPSPLPSQIAGEIRDFEPRQYIDKKERKRLNMMARSFQYAAAAAQMAVDHAALNKEAVDPDRFSVVLGSGTIPGEVADLGPAACVSVDREERRVNMARWGEQGVPNVAPMWMLQHIPNMMASHVSILHDARGPSNTITQTDAAGLLALGEAYRHLQRDLTDLALVGGADAKVLPIAMVRHTLIWPMSKRNQEPEKACRPFDRDRDGRVAGDGSGVLLLEELEHARRRGATILAEVVGFGAAFDRQRDGQGLARAIQAALADAQMNPADLDHVNAHGLSTREGDVWEARGLVAGLGAVGRTIPVWACKSYFGNLGAGAAPVELAASILALREGVRPGTLNYENSDPDCPLNVTTRPQPTRGEAFLKLSLCETGQCVAVVLRRWKD